MNEYEQIRERYELSIERIRFITEEKTASVIYRDYFQKVSAFILEINQILNRVQAKRPEECSLEELREENKKYIETF